MKIDTLNVKTAICHLKVDIFRTVVRILSKIWTLVS